jgi:hypothetical protein
MAGKLNKDKMQLVCDELAKGKSLRSICDTSDKLPHWVTVLQAVQRDEDLHEMYARARAIGAEVLADEMFDIANAPLTEKDRSMANAEVQRRRVQIDTLKWIYARQQPRGLRNKAEDTNQPSSITLQWGDRVEEQQEEAQVIKLVPKKD